ncbi:pheophytinase, chloroplastic [Coffea eugenioides]|uniref:Pheophytinase, chloroplastic-like n=1 Tax=Coffea arabica TaxID=13443 RepID=A0A6P6WJJ2_COFAR|nr:pheophytinase, chloroplastic [Coffea eugenioides]
MEIISCHAMHGQYLVKFRGYAVGKSPRSNQAKLWNFKERRLISVVSQCKLKALRHSYLDQLAIRRLGRAHTVRTLSALKGYEHGDPSVLSESLNSYVLDGKENVTDSDKTVPKVLIPGLPDENKGDSVASITSCSWEWKPKLNVHYKTAGSVNVDFPPVLFLPGFGVGSFHYEKQLKDLGRDFRAWAVDFLGQGLSLPREDPTRQTKNGDNLKSDVENFLWGFGDETEPWAKELVYSSDLWRDQVRYFIEEVIGEPVYIVGNSLGGYIAVYFAACYPELVKGVTLLNATPFWGFLPNPMKSPRWSSMFPWAGTFPIPATIKSLTEIVWQKMSDPESIAEILKQVYADHSTKVDKVFSSILEITKHPAAAASFASIMFAPQAQLTFKDSLSRCQMNNVPVCLMYGKEDPWVKPIWGLQVKRQLPEAPYYEISPAGHCPHDEVPEVVNFLLRGWIRNVESQGSAALPLFDSAENFQNDFAKDLEFVREGSRKLARVQIYGSESSFWKRMISLIKSQFDTSRK